MVASSQRLTREAQWRNPAALIVGGIGDHLIALPALRAVASLTQGRLQLLCIPTAREIFFPDLALAAVHPMHHYHLHQIGAAPAAHAPDYRENAERELAAVIGHCDLFLSFERAVHPSTTALLRVLKPQKSIGLLPGFDIEIPFHHTPHAMDLAFALPKELATDLRIEDFASPPKLPDAALALAGKLRADLPREAVLLAVHADTKPDKAWPPAKLGQLLNEFLDLHRHAIAIVVGVTPFTVDIGRNRQRVLSCHGIPLPAAFAIVGLCDLFLGIDSCMLHAADLYGIPGVGLFGPSDPSEFGFRFVRHLHVKAATMNEISVTDVANALETIWRSDFPYR